MRNVDRVVRSLLVAALVLASAFAATRASADDASEAQLHFELGSELYSQRRYAEALERFLSSNRLVPNPNVTFNIAQTYGLLRRWAEAYNWYESYLRGFELDEDEIRRGTEARDALMRRVAVLEVRTTPTGAALFVERVELGSVGTAPRRVAIAAGERTIIARAEGHREARTSVTALQGQVVSVELRLAAIVGVLAVRSEPSGATVRSEGSGEALGTTPLELTVPVGEIRLVVSHEGFVEVRRTVLVEDGGRAEVDIAFSRDASSVAVLSVTQPAGSSVLLDGEVVGEAPLTLDAVTPGVHRIEIRMEGREPWNDEIVLEAGGGTRVSATLEDPSSLHFEDVHAIGYATGGFLLASGLVIGGITYSQRQSFFADPSRAAYDSVGAMNVAVDVLAISGLVVLIVTLVIDLVVGGRQHSRAAVVVDR